MMIAQTIPSIGLYLDISCKTSSVVGATIRFALFTLYISQNIMQTFIWNLKSIKTEASENLKQEKIPLVIEITIDYIRK